MKNKYVLLALLIINSIAIADTHQINQAIPSYVLHAKESMLWEVPDTDQRDYNIPGGPYLSKIGYCTITTQYPGKLGVLIDTQKADWDKSYSLKYPVPQAYVTDRLPVVVSFDGWLRGWRPMVGHFQIDNLGCDWRVDSECTPENQKQVSDVQVSCSFINPSKNS